MIKRLRLLLILRKLDLDKEIMTKDRVLMFSEYKRKTKPELLRSVTKEDIDEFNELGVIYTDKTKVEVLKLEI